MATGRLREATPQRATIPLPRSSAWSHRFVSALDAFKMAVLWGCGPLQQEASFCLPPFPLSSPHYVASFLLPFNALTLSFSLLLSSSSLFSVFYPFSSSSLLCNSFPSSVLVFPLYLHILLPHRSLATFYTLLSVLTLTIVSSVCARSTPSVTQEVPRPVCSLKVLCRVNKSLADAV